MVPKGNIGGAFYLLLRPKRPSVKQDATHHTTLKVLIQPDETRIFGWIAGSMAAWHGAELWC